MGEFGSGAEDGPRCLIHLRVSKMVISPNLKAAGKISESCASSKYRKMIVRSWINFVINNFSGTFLMFTLGIFVYI
jgi:hypothetical protein